MPTTRRFTNGSTSVEYTVRWDNNSWPELNLEPGRIEPTVEPGNYVMFDGAIYNYYSRYLRPANYGVQDDA